jgi:hypothetical protein
VFENRVLRRIFGSKREEVVGHWRKPHNEELHKLYASLNIIQVIKSESMRWVGHVADMRDEKCMQYFLPENLKGRDHSEELGIDG